MTHPPGAVIFAGGEFLRYSGFMFSLFNTELPPGCQITMKQSVSIVENLNECLRKMNPESEWAWVQSDDHMWERDALMRLLDHELDVVVPLILQRSPPFSPVIFKERTAEGYLPYELSEIGQEPFRVHAAGSAGMLIRRHVLEEIGDPWFSYAEGQFLNEDLALCGKIRQAGYDIWCDPTVCMGHRSTFTIWPVYSEDKGFEIGTHMGIFKDGTPLQLTIKPRSRQEVAK